jgi:hypothetical protein
MIDPAARAAEWSTTEIQYEEGRLSSPFAGGKYWTPIITLQHASGNPVGDIFFFVDFLDDGHTDGFNDKDAYGEFYAYFSTKKIFGLDYGNGLLKDVGMVQGVNYDADVGYLGYLPGIYFDWNVPGFAFLRSQFTALIDDSDIAQDDGWQVDVSWAYPFQIRNQRFSIEGHVEYTANFQNVFGPQKDWIFGQPQFRWDAGYAFTGKKDVFFIGTEWQFWINKLGTGVTENAPQALAVWRF